MSPLAALQRHISAELFEDPLEQPIFDAPEENAKSKSPSSKKKENPGSALRSALETLPPVGTKNSPVVGMTKSSRRQESFWVVVDR